MLAELRALWDSCGTNTARPEFSLYCGARNPGVARKLSLCLAGNALLRRHGILRCSRASVYAPALYSSPNAVRNLRVFIASAFRDCEQDKPSSSRRVLPCSSHSSFSSSQGSSLGCVGDTQRQSLLLVQGCERAKPFASRRSSLVSLRWSFFTVAYFSRAIILPLLRSTTQ
jgi:hypothetical protein